MVVVVKGINSLEANHSRTYSNLNNHKLHGNSMFSNHNSHSNNSISNSHNSNRRLGSSV